jgi:PAS domain S-box-containing protein
VAQNSTPIVDTSPDVFHLLVEAVQDYAIFMLDPAGLVASWNRGAERIKGYKSGEIIGKQFSCFFTPEDRAAGKPGQVLAAALSAGRYEGEGLRVRQDGSRFWAHVTLTPLVDGAGNHKGFAKVTRDITERRQAEEPLVRSILDSAVDAILSIDETGVIESVNPATERIFGYAGGELLGRNVRMLMAEPDRSRHDAYIGNYLGTGQAKIIGIGREVTGRRKDGSNVSLHLSVGEFKLRSDGSRHFTGILRDISEARKVAHHLQQAQKMDAVGQLTGGIAHDFNNLLGVVIGNLDAVLEDIDPQSRDGLAITRALNGALHGADLTRRLLAFARDQPLEPKVFAINDMLPDVVAVLKRTLGASISINLAPSPDLWPAYADPSQVQDAVLNLAINARDAMPEGGVLTIETANITLGEDYAREDGEAKPGDYAMLAVTDTGTGIPPAIMKRVLEPFFTTKPVGKGTGLGLSMIYGFAKQSGGHLKIYSEVGHGTTVKLYLPRGRAAGLDEEKTLAAPGKAPGGHETILVAEDNAELRHTAVKQLTKLGYRVLEAANAEAALAILRETSGIDLLFSDIVMTGQMTGRDLAREASKLQTSLKILLTTGYAEKASAGPNDDWQILRKPYRREELARRVHSILGSSNG